MKKILCLAVVVILLVTIFTACGTGSVVQERQSFEVTDMTGETVNIPSSVERVIVLTPGDCETVFALGAGDKVVGRGTYCDKPNEVADIEEVASGTDMNLEQLLALDPDVIFVNCMEEVLECVDELKKNGIAVVQTNAQTIDEVYEAITLTGQVLGLESEAEDVISSMKQEFDDIAASVTEGKGKTIYFEVSPLEYGLYTAGTGTFMDEIACMLGLENVFSDIEGWPAISEEQVLERNPDYILTISYDSETMTAVEEIMSRNGWNEITAVKEGKVFQIIDNSLSRPSPELVSGARQLADFINGK